jgi:hypothetical protein
MEQSVEQINVGWHLNKEFIHMCYYLIRFQKSSESAVHNLRSLCQDPPQVGHIRAGQAYADQPPELTGSLIFMQALLIIFDPLNGKRGNVEMTDFNKYQSRNVKFRNPNVRIQHNVKF